MVRRAAKVRPAEVTGQARFDFEAHFEAGFDDHLAVARATRATLARPFGRLVELAAESVERGGKILFFGNGGSAADAQHLATELAVRFRSDREPIAALALTTDGSVLTATGNDLGFEAIFSRQLEALGRPGDLALALTTSGTSPNVVRGLEVARSLSIVPAAMTGRGGGDLLGLADPLLAIPSDSAARIQEMHITVGQLFCGALEQRLGLA